MGQQIGEAGDRQDLQPTNQRRLARVVHRDDHPPQAARPRQRRHRQDPVDVAHRPIQAQFADDQRLRQQFRDPAPHLAGGDQDPERDRQVVGRAGLADVGRREIDRHPPVREPRPGVPQRRAHPLLRLLDRRVGQPHDRQPRLALPDIDLDLHQQPIEPDRRATQHRGEHIRLPAIAIHPPWAVSRGRSIPRTDGSTRG